MSGFEGAIRQRHLRRCPRNTDPDGNVLKGWAPHKCRGRWEWTLDLGADPLTGKRRQETRGGFPTRAEAKAALDAMKARTKVTSGRSEVLTVGAWLDQWLASRHDIAATTRYDYASQIRLHIKPLLGRIRLVDLTPENIDAMLAALSEPEYVSPLRRDSKSKRGLSTASVNRAWDVLAAALNAAVKRRLLPWSPGVGVTPPTETNRPGQAWSPAEAAAFLNHPDVQGDRWFAAWRLVLTAGARRGEIAGARWEDIDLGGGRWWLSNARVAVGADVVDKAPKSARPRTVDLDPHTVEILRAHKTKQAKERLWLGVPDCGYVFTSPVGEPLSPHALTRRWAELVAATGLPVRTLHEGRHTAVTIGRVHAGVDAATMRERVGHAGERIAERYTHPHTAVSKAAAQAIADILDNPDAGPQAEGTGTG